MSRGSDAGRETDVAGEVTRHCYAGEEVVASTTLGTGWAAVTTHRVLAYNPTADGRRFQAVDRPNVSGVAVDARGDGRLLGWGLRGLVYGVAGVGGGIGLRALALGETLSAAESADAGGGVAPVGSVLSVVDLLAAGLEALSTLLLLGGIALAVVGVGLLGRYLQTRQPALVVDRFGDEPVRLAAPRADGERAARTLSAALET
jgi:hypothetical protein